MPTDKTSMPGKYAQFTAPDGVRYRIKFNDTLDKHESRSPKWEDAGKLARDCISNIMRK